MSRSGRGRQEKTRMVDCAVVMIVRVRTEEEEEVRSRTMEGWEERSGNMDWGEGKVGEMYVRRQEGK